MHADRTDLPGLEPPRAWQRVVWALAVASASVLLAALAARVAARPALVQWWMPLAVLAGVVLADFASGLVHWGADTWGRDDLPIVGRRLLRPFRLHHVNPDDFVLRSFLDTNGDVALLAIPLLPGLHAMPMDTRVGGPAVVAGAAFCGVGMLTNQIHQWAHGRAPSAVRVLQHLGLLLAPSHHAAHHDHPYAANYCITTGWCNGVLDATGFFRGLEPAITRITGARPRLDDGRYVDRHGIRDRRVVRNG